MKKSILIDSSLQEYFDNPCPVLSENNAKKIREEIGKGYDLIVEYGMGASTLYFLGAAQDKKCCFVSVENNFNWFRICVEQVEKRIASVSYKAQHWSLKEIRDFINFRHPAPQRLELWQEKMASGPFFRFHPQASSSFSGKLPWRVFGPVFRLAMKMAFLFPFMRPVDGEWRGGNSNFELVLRNVSPSLKDQFGESPTMERYINAGLKDIAARLEDGAAVRALIIIDGGPRHKIIERVLEMEDRFPHFKPTIILCDAWRKFYEATLSKRAGKFVKGTNKTIKGDPVETGISGPQAELWAGGERSGDELARKELWVSSAAA